VSWRKLGRYAGRARERPAACRRTGQLGRG